MSVATPKPLIKSAVVHDDGTISLVLECDGVRWVMERAFVDDAMAFGLWVKNDSARVILSGCGLVAEHQPIAKAFQHGWNYQVYSRAAISKAEPPR